MRLFVLALSLGVVAAACAPSEDEASRGAGLPSGARFDSARSAAVAEVRQTLDGAANDGLSGVAYLAVEDSVVLHEAYGLRDREGGDPMSVSTGFDVGSITKAVTAATVLALDERGSLSTADSVGRFFPDAAPALRAVTVAQLLDHTGGLPEYLDTEGDYEPITRAEALDRAAALRFEPGTDTAYSNGGYSVLAAVVERASGASFEAAAQEAVLRPAETPRIGYGGAGWSADALAVGYDGEERYGTPLDQPWLADGPPWGLRGNGGMLASAADLSAWFEAVFDGRVLGSDALATFKGIYGGPGPYGHRIGEAGGNDVFNAQVEAWPEAGVWFVFLTNDGDHPAEDVWDRLSAPVTALAEVAFRQAE